MKKLLLIILTALAATVAAMAESIIDRATKAVKSAPSLTATFRINGSDGRLVMSGACFRLEVPQMQTAFDGTTQFTLNEADSELTLTTPTLEEIAAINPLAFIGNLRSSFTASTLSDGRIRFVPAADGTDLEEIVTAFDSKTAMPVIVTMKTAAGEILIDHIKVTKGSRSIPASSFTIKQNKGITTIDLR